MTSPNIKSIVNSILRMAHVSGKGHVPSALSIVDFLEAYYSNKELKNQSDFILSKGHACLALYSTLFHFNELSEEELLSFSKFDSPLGGHPDFRKKPRLFSASTGSLGHGLPVAVGKAIANKEKMVFCLIGDGESNEGSIWEGVLLAGHLKLKNLVCVLDVNNSQNRSIQLDKFQEKFKAFDWETLLINGHNSIEINEVLNMILKNKSIRQRPILIELNTVKGYRIKDMEENHHAWHHRGLTVEEYNKFKLI